MGNLILVLGFVQALFAYDPTTYEIFENRFIRSYTPTVDYLQPGQIWHCSSSRAAAREHYRYVQLWKPTFIFSVNSEGLVENIGPHEIQALNVGSDEVSTVSKCPICRDRKYSFRNNAEGDLIISVSEKVNHKKYRGRSVSPEESWEVIFYFACENPKSHGNPNWESSDRYWNDMTI